MNYPLALFFSVLLFCSGSAAAVRIAVISDLNSSYGSTEYHAAVDKAVQRIVQLQPDLVISTGDMIAGQRTGTLLAREEIEPMWQSFHERVTEPLDSAGLPLVVTPGNHDGSEYPRFRLERQVYAEQWRSRKPRVNFVDDSHYPFYYAFEIENVLFVSLDATKPGPLNEEQKSWLGQVLAEHGENHEHKVLFSHVPLWPFSKQRQTEALFDTELEKMLQEHDADIFLSGHHHAYYPGYKDGIRYVSQSCLGAGPRTLLGDNLRARRSITLVDLLDDNSIEVQAYSAPEFTLPVPISSLPEKISSPQATLVRQDLASRTTGRVEP